MEFSIQLRVYSISPQTLEGLSLHFDKMSSSVRGCAKTHSSEGVDRGGGGTGIEGAESGVEGAESGVEGAGSGSRGGGKRGN